MIEYDFRRFFLPLIAIGIFSLLIFIILALYSSRPILIGNELSHVSLLHSIVFKKQLDIPRQRCDISYYGDRYYSNKPPGYAFLLSPFYCLYAKVFPSTESEHCLLFCKYANVVLSALSVSLIFVLLSTWHLSLPSCLFGLLAATFATIFPAYSCLANSIPLSVFLVVLSILMFKFYRDSGGKFSFLIVSLFSATYSISVDYSNGFVLLPLFIVLAGESFRRKKLVLSGGTVLLALLPLFYYNLAAFNKIFALTYSYYQPSEYVPWQGVQTSMSLSNVPSGLYGLLLSPGRGLFVISQVLLVGVGAVWLLKKKKDTFGFLLTLMAFSGIIIVSAYSLWHGGHSVGYRHILIPAMILGLLSAFYFENFHRWTRVLFGFLLALSIFNGFASFLIQLDPQLIMSTWKKEPADIHANFYRELLYPLIRSRGFGPVAWEKRYQEQHSLLTSDTLQATYFDVGVWEVLTPIRKGAKVSLEMAHARQGPLGSFKMQVYSDQDEDGLPDFLVAESPILQGTKIAQWSKWEFMAPGSKLFVGSSWKLGNLVFYERKPWPHQNLGEFMYYSRGGIPRHKANPVLTNLKISIE